MSEFFLNTNKPLPVLLDITLTQIVAGYIEAMFFTNGDIGDEQEHGEHALNERGTAGLTHKAIASICIDCEWFYRQCFEPLTEAFAYDYEPEQAGRDLWFTRQGHGTGFYDRDELNVLHEAAKDLLTDKARELRETYVCLSRGWIYHN